MLKKIAVFSILFSCLFATLRAEEWGTDFGKAKTQAAAENKLLLMDFTGSDWCYYCQILEKEVFSQKKFLDYAAKKYVLVKLDFPSKSTQSDEEKAQNEKLQKEYNVEGYPSVVVADSKGKELFRLVGYRRGGLEAYIQALEESLAKAGQK